jgi:hypothetical protein
VKTGRILAVLMLGFLHGCGGQSADSSAAPDGGLEQPRSEDGPCERRCAIMESWNCPVPKAEFCWEMCRSRPGCWAESREEYFCYLEVGGETCAETGEPSVTYHSESCEAERERVRACVRAYREESGLDPTLDPLQGIKDGGEAG